MEINEKEFVRTKNGIIEQLTLKTMLHNHYGHFFTRSDRNECYAKEDITKHSKDIIDLIEVGDYVNGSKVIDIRIDEELEIGVESDNLIYHYIQNKDIKSILTHEQFESNAYKIEKER